MTKLHEPKALAEIHEIREKMQKEMEGMTREEQLEYIRKNAESFTKRHNLKLPGRVEPAAAPKD